MEIKWKKTENEDEFLKALESGQKVRVGLWKPHEFIQIKAGSLFEEDGTMLMEKYSREEFTTEYICEDTMHIENGVIPSLSLEEIFEALANGDKITASDWAEDEYLMYDPNGHLIDENCERYPVKDLIERLYRYPQLEIKK